MIGFGLWVSAFVLEMSWVGHQPLSPDRLHLNAINNHGVMYVSNADLHWLYGLRGVGVALFILGTVLQGFAKGLEKRRLQARGRPKPAALVSGPREGPRWV